MPISLIVFRDKTHTYLNGTLSVPPGIFTLSLFTITSQNKLGFWRPLAYIPQDTNIAEGYNVFTGEVDDKHPHNDNYGEVHT